MFVIKRYLILIAISALLGCGNSTPNETRGHRLARAVAQRDYGSIDVFQNCGAEPRRKLSELEECEIRLLQSTCTPEADCLVTCLSSPDAYRGGGCYHVCFNPPSKHRWERRPSIDFSECDKLRVPEEGEKTGRHD